MWEVTLQLLGEASPGEAMASAFILAKSSRSPLKKLPDRLIPAAAIGNGDRPLSLQGEGGYIPGQGQGMMPLSPQEEGGHGGRYAQQGRALLPFFFSFLFAWGITT